VGADIELGNFIANTDRIGGSGYEASRALLAEVDGQPGDDFSSQSYWGPAISGVAGTGTVSSSASSKWAYNIQDVGRRHLSSTGGCIYVDLDHLELCTPEVLSAFDHVAAWHAMLRIARIALDNANEGRAPDRKIQVLVNNTDGQGSSYGSHLSFLINRRTFDNIFLLRRPHYLQALASFQASLLLLTGQGKVGSENGRPHAVYNISQRADYLETLMGVPTTFNRPIVNARDETLCGRHGLGDPEAPARLHVICFDSALAHGSALFRVGPMQLFLTLLERELVNSRLILEDPLAALQSFTDPTLKARARLISGESLTAVELQSAYLDCIKRHAAQGVFEDVVPRAEEMIALWEDTVVKFANADWTAVARRGIDWVLKLMAIERAMDEDSRLDWDSPELKMLDHTYGSLGDDGLYWAYEKSGFVEQLVTQERIAHFTTNPPADTRAWTRAMLLRRASEEGVTVFSMDWDAMTFKLKGRHSWPAYRTLDLASPFGFTEAEARPIFESAGDFRDLLDGLESLAAGNASAADVLITN
jgi:proteasome accessory factor A